MEPELDQINIIPLVDVMLVMFVIVLTTASFITTGQIPVHLAKAKEAAVDRKDVPLVITVASDGRLYFNDQPIPPDGLKMVLPPHPRESLVLVRADKMIVLWRFVDVVDEVRALGFKQVSLEVVRS
ncbi:MAG: ExbD/TolR family protein [Nitrospira sp.]